jgi:mono/diheme cytochrome c family protein
VIVTHRDNDARRSAKVPRPMPSAPRILRNPAVLAAAAGATALVALSGCNVKEKDADLVAGKRLFVSKCGSCHVLNRAGTKGTVGPNLDEAFRQSLADGYERDTIRGLVRHQILYPRVNSEMPAKLVTGGKEDDVAAYVARVAALTGKDAGLLATAVKAAGAGKPAVEKNGTLEIDADPNGQLSFVTKLATAGPGSVVLKSKNASSTPHNIAIEGGGLDQKGQVVSNGGVSQVSVKLKAGTYTFYCSVQGHRAGGMFGKLTVKK